MINIIWPIVLMLSFIYAFFTGRINDFNNSIFNSGYETIEFLLKMTGTMCIWNGFIKILQETTLINKIRNLISPIMKFLFPNIDKKDKEYNEISLNLIANLLGIGNAATPLGVEAMKSMQEKNKNKQELTDDMGLFIVLNTASLQLIPTTIIAIRTALNSKNPAIIIFPVLLVTIVADITGIIVCKILMKKM